MSPPSADAVRVLIDDREVRVDGLDGVVALARAGRIHGRTQVSLPGSRSWQPASSIPEVAAALPAGGDPWSAWDDMDDSAADDAFESYAERTDEVTLPASSLEALEPEPLEEPPSIEELPVGALSPIANPASPAPDEERLVAKRKPRPAAEGGPRSPGSAASGGKVIAFPSLPEGGRRARRPVQSSAQPAEEPVPLPEVARLPAAGLPPVDLPDPRDFLPKAPPKPPGTRWWRVSLVGGGILAAMLAVNWYVTWTASLTFPPPGAPMAPPAPAVAAAPAPALPPPPIDDARPDTPVDSPYIEMEADLRALLLDSPREIAADGQLEDALLIELRRLRVQTTGIEAPVLTWAGRKKDVPQSAEIHIHYTSRPGELDRELGAIGLVVGRYVHTFALEVPVLDVVVDGLEGGARLVTLDPDAARKLYLKRIDLDGFLQQMRRK